MSRKISLLLAVGVATQLACSEDATVIVVAVGTNFDVPDEIGFVRVAKCGPEAVDPGRLDELCTFHDFDLRQGTRIPFSAALVPSGSDLDERISVTVAGYPGRPRPLEPPRIARFSPTRFRAHQTLTMPVFLLRECAGPLCGGEGPETCCREIQLVEVAPGQELTLLDAGASFDAGEPDAGFDAGVDAARPECEEDDECDDSLVCTENHCVDGTCNFDTAVTCPEMGDACSMEMCTEEAGGCTQTFAEDGDPCGTASQSCCGQVCVNTATSNEHCSACGMACGPESTCRSGECRCNTGFTDCDDEIPGCEADLDTDASNCGECNMVCEDPTPVCIDGRCGACMTAADCPNDGIDCTAAPACRSGRCEEDLMPGFCLVGGECYDDLERTADNDCLECRVSTNPRGLTIRNGSACDDGEYCTTGDTCDPAGVCRGGVGRTCSDGLTCTDDDCDEEMNTCVNTLRDEDGDAVPDYCRISVAGTVACFGEGAPSPSGGCAGYCNPALSTTMFDTNTMNRRCTPAGMPPDVGYCCTSGCVPPSVSNCGGCGMTCTGGMACAPYGDPPHMFMCCTPPACPPPPGG